MTTQVKPLKAVLSGDNVTGLGEFNPGDAISPEHGGTGLDALGAANQVLGVNASGTGMEGKTLVAGQSMAVSHTPGAIIVNVLDVNNQDGNHLINYFLGVQ